MVLAPQPKTKQGKAKMTEDCKELMNRLVQASASSCSLRRLAESTGWLASRVSAALDEAEKAGAIKRMGSSGLHFAVADNLGEILENPPDVQPVPEPAPAPEPTPAPAPDPVPAPEPAPAQQQEPPPQQEPQAPDAHPQKKSKLSYLMAKIKAVKAPEILEGAAREARLCEIFDACLDVVIEINEAITEIATKFPMWVDPQKDLLQLIRVTPPEGSTAPGGIKLSYFPKDRKGFRRERFLLEEPWPKMLTSGGGGYIVRKVEREAVALVERMTNFVLRQK
jgi:hypothetical protein